MTDPATIARGLSPAQAKALLWLPEDGSAYPTEDMLAAAYRELHNLETFGLAKQQGWRWSITPLGLAVRAALVKMQAPPFEGGAPTSGTPPTRSRLRKLRDRARREAGNGE